MSGVSPAGAVPGDPMDTLPGESPGDMPGDLVDGRPEAGPVGRLVERKLPPIAELAVVSIALMMTGGILLAAHLPAKPNLAAPIALVALGGALTLADLWLLVRIRPFAWGTFRLVLRWALAAYAVIAGLLVFVFARNHTPASTMAVLVVTLVIFAVDVPTVLAFTVARFVDPAADPEAG